jgi:uncharacterized membrane protein
MLKEFLILNNGLKCLQEVILQALEKPDLLVNDVRKFLRSLRFNPYDESGGQSNY